MKVLDALKRHKWRYLAIVLGFVFVCRSGERILLKLFILYRKHSYCRYSQSMFPHARLWIAAGRFATFDGRYLLVDSW
jgi:hypothetical protein